MSKRKELNEEARNQIISAWKCKVPDADILRLLNFPLSTVYDVINYYKDTGNIKSPLQSGRKPILTERDKHYLIHVVKENRKVPLNILNEKFTQATSTEVSTHTYKDAFMKKVFFLVLAKESLLLMK